MNAEELASYKFWLDGVREVMIEELERTEDENDVEIFNDVITKLSEILDDLECYIPEVEV